MALGDSIEVTYMTGAGKTDREKVEVRVPGGNVVLEAAGQETAEQVFYPHHVPEGLVYVTSYTRKGVKVERLVVGVSAFVAAVEKRR